MQAAGGHSISNTGTAPGQPQGYQVVTSQHSATSTHSVTSPHYAVVNFAQKTSPSGTANQTGTGSASSGAASQRSSKSSTGNRTGSSGSVGAGLDNNSREATPPPVPPHPPPEDNSFHNDQGFHNNQSNMQPIPQVSDWLIQVM